MRKLFVGLMFLVTSCTEVKPITSDDPEGKANGLAKEFIKNLGMTGEVKQCTRMVCNDYYNHFWYFTCTIVVQNGDRKEILSIDCDLSGMSPSTCILSRGF